MFLKVFIIFTIVHFSQCKVVPLTCNYIRAFVDGHNSRRLQLAKGLVPGQPAASEMNALIWDKELAKKAHKWASNYRTSHNPDDTIPSKRFITQENLYWLMTTDRNHVLDPETPIKNWFIEYKDYDFKPLDVYHFEPSKKIIGHYTQIAWSDTVYIGCAMSVYPQGHWTQYFVVCYYGPRGNILGQRPYKYKKGPSNRLLCGAKNCSKPYGDKCS